MWWTLILKEVNSISKSLIPMFPFTWEYWCSSSTNRDANNIHRKGNVRIIWNISHVPINNTIFCNYEYSHTFSSIGWSYVSDFIYLVSNYICQIFDRRMYIFANRISFLLNNVELLIFIALIRSIINWVTFHEHLWWRKSYWFSSCLCAECLVNNYSAFWM